MYVCVCVSQLCGNMRAFACKLWPILHVQITYSVMRKLSKYNNLWITDVSKGACMRVNMSVHAFILTDDQYFPALSVCVNLACRSVSRGHPLWHCDRLEKHCWAARNPPNGTQ